MTKALHRAYVATYLRGPGEEWPHDVGDDPDFRTSQRGGPVTWGVCRRPLRSAVNAGDVVVFFSADRTSRLEDAPIRYVFVGWATVAEKISQADIWRSPKLKKFRRYCNLVIRPKNGGFEHFEPCLPTRLWHKDWLRRIADTRGFTPDDAWPIEQTNFVNARTRLGGSPIRWKANYVVFAPDGKGTTVLADPPLIAEVRVNGRPERWSDTRLATELRRLLSIGSPRTLRTTNRQRSHPHIRLDTSAEEIRERMEKLCVWYRLRSRRRGGSRSPVLRPPGDSPCS